MGLPLPDGAPVGDSETVGVDGFMEGVMLTGATEG